MDEEIEPMMSRPEVRLALNLARQNSKGEVVDKKIKSDIRDQHYYESVKYVKTITPTNQTKFLPSLQSLDIEDSVQQLYIWVGS